MVSTAFLNLQRLYFYITKVLQRSRKERGKQYSWKVTSYKFVWFGLVKDSGLEKDDPFQCTCFTEPLDIPQRHFHTLQTLPGNQAPNWWHKLQYNGLSLPNCYKPTQRNPDKLVRHPRISRGSSCSNCWPNFSLSPPRSPPVGVRFCMCCSANYKL